MALGKAAYVVDAIRTPIGKYRGGLSRVRPDDLAAHVIRALGERQAALYEQLDHVIFGATNQSGEDNRNVARMALLLAGVPIEVPGATVNRLCGSGMEAVGQLARAIRAGDSQIGIAGGVESMSRAPFVMPKADTAFSRCRRKATMRSAPLHSMRGLCNACAILRDAHRTIRFSSSSEIDAS